METRLTGKHVLFILLGFFGIVFAVNGYFLFVSLDTLPGEERGATYEAGLKYNRILAAERSQESLHWVHKAQSLPNGGVSVRMTGAEGAPVAGLNIEGWLDRPASKGAIPLTFKETDTGRYEAPMASLPAGSWILTIKAEKPRPGAEPA